MALSLHLNWPTIPPNQSPSRPPKRAARETSFVSTTQKPATQGGKMVKLITLAILAIFVKQRTYLATLPLFGHLAPYLATLPHPPRVKEIGERRNVTSSVRRSFAQG
jgi:hypothetical protein